MDFLAEIESISSRSNNNNKILCVVTDENFGRHEAGGGEEFNFNTESDDKL